MDNEAYLEVQQTSRFLYQQKVLSILPKSNDTETQFEKMTQMLVELGKEWSKWTYLGPMNSKFLVNNFSFIIPDVLLGFLG